MSKCKEMDKLKKWLFERFSIKDPRETKQKLGMRIERDKTIENCIFHKLNTSRRSWKDLTMQDLKYVGIPLGSYFTLSMKESPSNMDKCAQIQKISYATIICDMVL